MPTREGTTALIDSGDLYRALQQHKTDDLDAVRRVVAEQETTCTGTDRPCVVDLCSGIGRTVDLYPPQRWRLTCVDSDAVALEAIARLRPDATVVRSWVEDHVDVEPAHLVICAHHAANEVDDPLALIDTAARMVATGGALYLDLLVGTTHYPASHLREAVRELDIGGARWLFQTVVLPDEHASSHTLLLIAEQTDGEGAIPRRVVHRLRRRIPTEAEVLARAAARGLTLGRTERAGRYVFLRPIPSGA